VNLLNGQVTVLFENENESDGSNADAAATFGSHSNSNDIVSILKALALTNGVHF
jgi:hypothetical protein